MKKFQVDSKDDITEEPYKGPGPVVTSAGYVALSHLAATIVGAVAFGAAGFFAAERTVAVKEAFTRIGNEYGSSANWFKKIPGKIIGFIPKFSEWMVSHIPGARKISGHSAFKDSSTAVIFAGGIGATSGWIASTIWGIAKGGHHGNKGKRQFERAKAEIKDLRERNDDLEKINNDLHAKYVEAATRFDRDATANEAVTPAVTEQSSAPLATEPATVDARNAHAHDEKPQHKKTESHGAQDHETPSHTIHKHDAHESEHHGKIHAHTQHEYRAQV